MNITYTKHGDYYLPDLTLPKQDFSIGKYGQLRLDFIKKHRKGFYANLMISGNLPKHLYEIDERSKTILEQFLKNGEADAPNKSTHQMEWVGFMNNLKSSAEEVIAKELIYV